MNREKKRCHVCERSLPLWKFAHWRAQCKLCVARIKRLKYAAKKGDK